MTQRLGQTTRLRTRYTTTGTKRVLAGAGLVGYGISVDPMPTSPQLHGEML
jgi:hypothetical protein